MLNFTIYDLAPLGVDKLLVVGPLFVSNRWGDNGLKITTFQDTAVVSRERLAAARAAGDMYSLFKPEAA